MLTTYLKSTPALVRYRSSPAGPHLDGFVDWLETQGVPDTHAPERHGPAVGAPILTPAISSNITMVKGFQTQCSGHPLR
jgi:hypothetical protein